jgi:hypothetical protein
MLGALLYAIINQSMSKAYAWKAGKQMLANSCCI